MTAQTSAITYLRVSTEEQGRSTLGIERQREDLNRFCQIHQIKIDQEFVEVRSGKGSTMDSRPILMQAIAAAQRSKSILLVATISRLSRDVGLISTLINDANVRFMSAETGIDAQPFEIYLRAVFADEEKRKISIRTRGALAALKRAGVKLGNPNLSDVRPLAWAASRAKADKHANQYMDLIKAFRRNGKTYGAIANVLNDMGAKTSRGGKWYGTTVRNIEKRAV